MPELLGTSAAERAKVEMLFGVLMEFKMAMFRPMFSPDT